MILPNDALGVILLAWLPRDRPTMVLVHGRPPGQL